MKPQSFTVLARLLHTGSGLVIGPHKTYLLETRLASILKAQKLRDLDALAERVRPDGVGALERQVIEAMTTTKASSSATTSHSRISARRPCRGCSPRGPRRRGCVSGPPPPVRGRRPIRWR
jgi:hypothetical protein